MIELYKDITTQTWNNVLSNIQIPTGSDVAVYSQNQRIYNPVIIGGKFERASFATDASGARVEIFPISDPTIGLVSYDSSNNVVFKTIIDGTDVGDVVIGNYAGGQGILYDKSGNSTIFAGTVQATAGWFGNGTNGVSIDSSGLVLAGTGRIRTATSGVRIDIISNQIYVYDASVQRMILSSTGLTAYSSEGTESGYINNGPVGANTELWMSGTSNIYLREISGSGSIVMRHNTTDTVIVSSTLFNIATALQCDSFRIDQVPATETITPTKTITISCNGTNYKIPVVAA